MSVKALERHLQPLIPFILIDGVTEICINKPGVVFIEKDNHFTQHVVEELELGFLETLAALIAEFNNKDFPSPLVSGILPGGERVQFVMNPACENKQVICSIRRHQMKDVTLEDYEKSGVFDSIANEHADLNSHQDEYLKSLYHKKDFLNFLKVAILSKKNILFCGGTGTGKTTLLNTCLKLISEKERLITIEDTREVVVKQPNAAHLIYNDDDPRITALKIFKACLRLRPDRVFLSELRGEEALAFLRATNSGHPGSLSTIHADTPEAAFDQLVFMVQQAGSTSSDERIRAYVKSIINIVIPLKRCLQENRFMYIPDIYFDAIEREGGRVIHAE